MIVVNHISHSCDKYIGHDSVILKREKKELNLFKCLFVLALED